jgi:hypothetical protein
MRKMMRLVMLILFGMTLLDAPLSRAQIIALDSIRVNLEVKDVALRETLQSLISQTKLQIVYNDALVNGIKVSYACNHVTLRKALEELLKPTPLTFEAMQDGQIVIVRRKVNLKGYIKAAETGETLPYANVTIKGTSWGTASNVNGYFVLVNVPAGLCTLRVSYIGYELVELPVTLTDDQETLIVKMKSKILQGAAVTVTVDDLQTIEFEQDAGQLRISAQQMANLPSVGEVDVFRSLQLLPGISGVSDGSAGLYIRGGTPEQNLVLFDGMKIYHIDHFFGFLSAFNTDVIKDVRVFKGGFPAKFGGRTSSIVELTGKSGSYDKFQTGVGLNLLSGSGIMQLPISGRGAWLLSFRRSYTDLIKSDSYNRIYNTIAGPNRRNDSHPGGASPVGTRAVAVAPDFYYHDLTSKLSYSVSSHDILSMSFYNSRDHLTQSQNLSNPISPRATPNRGASSANVSANELTIWGNIGASGKWSRVWNDHLYSSFLGAYSVYSSEHHGGLGTAGEETNQNNLVGASSLSEIHEVGDFSLQWENEWHVSKTHKAEFGLEFNRTNVGIRFTANDTVNILQRDDEAAQTVLYLQDTWKALPPLELRLGVRAINYAPTKTNYIEPRASFRLSLRNGLWLKGAWGEYHQFVNRITNDNALNGNRDFWLLADTKLAPSFAEHKILGLTYEKRDFLLNVEAYHKNLDGIAEFSQSFRRAPESKAAELFFLGTGVAKGLELIAQKKSGNWNGWASYTLAKVDYRIPAFNDGEAFPADQDRRHEIKLVGNYALGKWNLAATWIFASGTPYTVPEIQYTTKPADDSIIRYIQLGDKNANRLPAYHRLDISFSRQFTSETLNFDLGISIFNLYDHKNVWYREYVLNTSPAIVCDVTTLGFTPTITFKVGTK